MARLTDILEKVKGYHPRADTDLINKAYVYASRMHDGQSRKSGDAYFTHPVSVADIIADMRLDASSVCAALLHDVVEDCEASVPDIETVFGEEVAFLVDGVTKLGKVNFASREDRQAESFRKMLVAMARDIRVLLVKLADRLDNMRTLEHMSESSQERIARETLEIYAPLAGRLGIQWLKAELEDLSFKHLEPEAYAVLDEQVKAVAKNTDAYMAEVTAKLKKMLVTRGFSVEISGRRKHLYSLHRKMKSSGIGFEQVHDFVAFRVITESVADCYAALGVIHSDWTPVPGRFKDYIALPKSNMYQSLHTTVIGPASRRVEIQIRTHEMHRTADYGIAAHWQYKEHTGGIDPKDAARFVWLRQLLEFQKDVADPEEFYESVKVDLFPEDVYVFTPKGRRQDPPARCHARRLRVRGSLRGRASMLRRPCQRRDRSIASQASERRRRGGHDQQEPSPEQGLAGVCDHQPGSRAHSRLPADRRAKACGEARQGAARKGASKERHVAFAVLEEQARQGSSLAVPRWD